MAHGSSRICHRLQREYFLVEAGTRSEGRIGQESRTALRFCNATVGKGAIGDDAKSLRLAPKQLRGGLVDEVDHLGGM